MKELLKLEFIRFLLVGVVNTIFSYVVFALITKLGVSYPIALLFSTTAGVLFNFKTIGVLVFGSHNNLLIFKFCCVYAVIYLVNVGALHAFGNINHYEGQAILAFPLGLLSYVLNKFFVFPKTPQVAAGEIKN